MRTVFASLRKKFRGKSTSTRMRRRQFGQQPPEKDLTSMEEDDTETDFLGTAHYTSNQHIVRFYSVNNPLYEEQIS